VEPVVKAFSRVSGREDEQKVPVANEAVVGV
jgi:hypothetical protein